MSVLRRNAHLKLLTLVFFLFILEKLTESYMLFTSGVEGTAATLGPGLAVFDSIADVFLFIALIWFFHSFHRILNPARAVVLFLLYLVGWLTSIDRFTAIFPASLVSLLKNLSVLPLLIYILILGITIWRRTSNGPPKTLLFLSLLILSLISVITFIDGILEQFMGLDLPKDLFAAFVFPAAALWYLFYFCRNIEEKPLMPSEGLIEKYGITPREAEIMGYLFKGHSYREISDMLFISPATTKTHIHNIYVKTGETSRFSLMNLVKTFAIKV